MKKWSSRVFAVILAFVIICSMIVMSIGCKSSADKTGVFKIGIVAAKTGTNAGQNDDAMYGVRMLVKDINAGTNPIAEKTGGIKVGDTVYTVELIEEDGGYDAAMSSSAVSKLYYQEDVFITWGPASTQATLASFPVIEDVGMISWGISTSNSCMKSKSDPVQYFFRSAPPSKEKINLVYDLLKKNNPSVKKIALIVWQDDAGNEAKNNVNAWKDVWNANSAHANDQIQVYTVGPYTHDNTQWTAMVQNILNWGPDSIDLGPAFTTDTAAVLKELKNQGWKSSQKPTFRSVGAAKNVDLEPLLVGNLDAAEGFVQTVAAQPYWSKEIYTNAGITITDRVSTLIGRCATEYPKTADARSTYGNVASYMQMEASLKAVKEVGSIAKTPENITAVAQKITTYTLDTASGPLTFGGEQTYGSKHQLDAPTWLGKLKVNGTKLDIDFYAFEDLKIP
ncbi:MAG: ABC transporter substrate-binding protein [Chloroflexi bacterium]|nr:ABC transporter substrate-binding protein [Chloroflexota bacterium]